MAELNQFLIVPFQIARELQYKIGYIQKSKFLKIFGNFLKIFGNFLKIFGNFFVF